MCVYYCSTYYKAVRGGGGGVERGGHVLRETTASRGQCELVCPSRTEARGEVRERWQMCMCCVYYCSTYYKAVREGGGGEVEDMCYERLRAEAYVN